MSNLLFDITPKDKPEWWPENPYKKLLDAATTRLIPYTSLMREALAWEKASDAIFRAMQKNQNAEIRAEVERLKEQMVAGIGVPKDILS
jgi:hypothetical protein